MTLRGACPVGAPGPARVPSGCAGPPCGRRSGPSRGARWLAAALLFTPARAMAASVTGGVGVGVEAVRASAGDHPWFGAVALAGGLRGAPFRFDVEALAATRGVRAGGDTLRTTLLRPALLLGWELADGRLDVGAGGAVTWITSDGVGLLQLGVRGRVGTSLPVGEVVWLRATVGVTTRGRSMDGDLLVGAELRGR